jgi:hypothetical protein
LWLEGEVSRREFNPSPDIIEVDGVRFTAGLLSLMANPDPRAWIRFERNGDEVTAESKRWEGL